VTDVRILRVILSAFLLLDVTAAGASALAGATVLGLTSLAERYRTGRIILRSDEDWTSNLPADLFFESRGCMAVASDGSVFVSNTIRHMIYKFDAGGKFVKAFGRQGQGPGDLTYPGRLSILDDKYLVVGEYATNQRISLFDLDGKFVKIVGTGHFTSQAVALKDGKIAYLCLKGRMEQKEMVNIGDVFILDWKSGAQKPIVRYEIRNPMERMPGGGIVLAAAGAVVLARTHDGGLVVGTTQSPCLDIFSADGTKLRTLDTGWKAIPVTSEYRNKYKAFQRRVAEAEGKKLPMIDPLLPESLEILQDVWTDSEGNILVCKKTDCLEDCPLAIRAYSPQGDFLCDFTLDPGPFVLSADWRFKRIILTAGGLYGLLEFKDDPDGFLHLVRTVFRS
jgi:hypothetical protein